MVVKLLNVTSSVSNLTKITNSEKNCSSKGECKKEDYVYKNGEWVCSTKHEDKPACNKEDWVYTNGNWVCSKPQSGAKQECKKEDYVY